MTRRRPLSPVNALALTIPCVYCSAPEGAWCWTRKGARPGRRVSFLHVDRTWRFLEAWHLGVREGQVWSTDQAARALDRTDSYSEVVRGSLVGLDAQAVDRVHAHFVRELERDRAWLERGRLNLSEVLGVPIE